jgi:hypothetical protein
MLKDLTVYILIINEVRLDKCSIMVYAVNFMSFFLSDKTFGHSSLLINGIVRVHCT